MFFRDNIYTLLTGEYKEGITDLDRLASFAIVKIFRKKMKNYIRSYEYPRLTDKQKKEVKKFYKRYAKPDLIYHRVYSGSTEKFHKEYIPDNIYFSRIEPYYTDRLCSKYLDNKCYYYRFFSNIKQPGLITMRIGDSWLDGACNLISYERAVELVRNSEQCVVKRATDSEGGYGLKFLKSSDEVDKFKLFSDNNKTDIVVQEVVRQHSEYAKLNETSVNTLRLMSLLKEDGVWVYSVSVRIGSAGEEVDNVAKGGIICGVNPDGRLTEKGVTYDGRVVTAHPELGIKFSEIVLPGFDKAVELVKKAHGIMGHCRLAAWDVAIDKDEEAVLIEVNLSLGVIHTLQIISGPLFGKETEKILEDVFYDDRGRRRKRDFFGLNPRDYYYIRDNILGVLFGYYRAGYSHPYLLGNKALKHIDKKLVNEVVRRFPKLSAEQRKTIRQYYKPYARHVQTDSHRVYTGKSGRFFLEYIPEDMYMCDIDRCLSDRNMAYYLDNKCYYYRLFPSAKQPELLAMRINGIWLDDDYQVITKKQVVRRVLEEKVAVLKAASDSEGGEGVYFLDLYKMTSKKNKVKLLADTIDKVNKDIVIQKAIKQHPDLGLLHQESINSLRIVSLLTDDKVEILSRSLKIGAGNSRLDNGCMGGLYCGVKKDHTLGAIGALDNGMVVTHHPDLGYEIKGKKIPGIEKCDELVRTSHAILGHHRLVSWDVAVDDEGDAVLIEANLGLGGSDDVQVVNGPFFGDNTERVLKEVYGIAY